MIATWPDLAACRSADPELFYSPGEECAAAKEQREAAARAVCAGCPVKDACLTHALAREPWGIWGGATEEERTGARARGFTVTRREEQETAA